MRRPVVYSSDSSSSSGSCLSLAQNQPSTYTASISRMVGTGPAVTPKSSPQRYTAANTATIPATVIAHLSGFFTAQLPLLLSASGCSFRNFLFLMLPMISTGMTMATRAR